MNSFFDVDWVFWLKYYWIKMYGKWFNLELVFLLDVDILFSKKKLGEID